MEALDAPAKAGDLFDKGGAEERRLAAHLMELFPDQRHLTRLEQVAADPDPAVRRQALRALACQMQTPLWEATQVRLLEATAEETRQQAIQSLSRRRTVAARQALQDHLDREPSAPLRTSVQQTLASD